MKNLLWVFVLMLTCAETSSGQTLTILESNQLVRSEGVLYGDDYTSDDFDDEDTDPESVSIIKTAASTESSEGSARLEVELNSMITLNDPTWIKIEAYVEANLILDGPIYDVELDFDQTARSTMTVRADAANPLDDVELEIAYLGAFDDPYDICYYQYLSFAGGGESFQGQAAVDFWDAYWASIPSWTPGIDYIYDSPYDAYADFVYGLTVDSGTEIELLASAGGEAATGRGYFANSGGFTLGMPYSTYASLDIYVVP